MDESRRLAMRRAHTKHQGFCTCGKIVCGNGGIFNHLAMHRRRRDGHHYLVEDRWRERFDVERTPKGPRGVPKPIKLPSDDRP